jgi:hypothetical protein
MSRAHGVNPRDYARQQVFANRPIATPQGTNSWAGRLRGESMEAYEARLHKWYEEHPDEGFVPMACTCPARPYAHIGHPVEEWRWVD